jgi:hypothetical protein
MRRGFPRAKTLSLKHYWHLDFKVIYWLFSLLLLSSCTTKNLEQSGPTAANLVLAQCNSIQAQAFEYSAIRLQQIQNAIRAAASAMPLAEDVKCGDVISQNTTLSSDLDCSTTPGFALTVIGQDVNFDGGGHAILLNSTTQLGVLISGTNQTLQNLTVQGAPSSVGILAYNAANLSLTGNMARGLAIAVDYYADQGNLGTTQVRQNNFSDSCIVGLRFQTDPSLGISNPVIQGNDFTDSQQFAIQLKLDSATLQGTDQNIFLRAANGLQLIGNSFTVSGLDLSSALIPGTSILVTNTGNLQMQNSTLAPSSADGIALSLYDVQNTVLQTLSISGGNVGIKSGIDGTHHAQFSMQNSLINGAATAGIMLQSGDSAAYDLFTVSDSDLRLNPVDYGIWLVPGTQATPILQNVLF